MSSGDIQALTCARTAQLNIDQPGEIARMQSVPNLESMSTEAKVFQRSSGCVRIQPIGKDSLLGGSELSRACKHSTTVDPDRKLESRRIFLR